jgi:hypothetical protein
MHQLHTHHLSGGSEQPAQTQEQPAIYAPTNGGAFGQTHSISDGAVPHQPLLAHVSTHVESSHIPQTSYGPAPVASSSPPPPPPPVAYPVSGGHLLNQYMPAQLQHATSGGNVPQSTHPGLMQPAAAIHSGLMPPLPPTSHVSSVHQQQQQLSLQGPDDGIVHSSASDPGLSRDPQPALPNSSSQSPIVSHRTNTVGSTATTNVVQNSGSTHFDDHVDTELDSDDDDDHDDDISDELRKLDEDFQKNLERAKKVFVNRMDNLQRSQIEREAQHLKTLEKHEKERAEFEKRLAQEAEQQHRRIEQLQREWDKRRETVALHKRKQKDGAYEPSEPSSDGPSSGSPSCHVRSVSTASSNFSISPAMGSHKLPQDPSVDGGGTTER